jgi:hypothetical protein
MGNFKDRVDKPLAKVQGPLPGEDLIPAVKAAMLAQPVFQALFGKDGSRIFTEKLPNYNDTIVPLIEFRWKGERWQSQHTRIYGTLIGDIVLPADLMGQTDRFRALAAAFGRWVESDHGLFSASSGLIEFGTNLEFKYDSAIKAGGDMFPVIDLTIPVVFDLTIFQAKHPEVDLEAPLDADLFGWIETYAIRIKDEKGNVKIDTQVLSNTGQNNG